ncbi:hepatitis A virus cellular receptor 2 homolog isoform X2 [Thamnophis elegans]|uniref:hepatitis A virus cellular receptor 2 homolog isoform X2 n=1 Tax=Thamnophis elegans TaxID=35005 RepID=UPI0013777EFE|nr:hepatitis A virus cellular receptor 2 homolog isoform X2 [Thamnophis elegans]
MFSCLLLKQILLMILTGCFTTYAETVIQGSVGENITLPCHYSVKDNGLTDTCWGRSCPSMGSCSKKMISINKKLEIHGRLQKYHLMGSVSQGDVSLTIANITEDDVGTYCCRVEYDGLFNDGKMLFKLLIKEASLHTTPIYFTTSNFVSEPTSVVISESPLNNISLYTSIMVKKQGKNLLYQIGLYFGIGWCVLLFAIIILLLIKRCRDKKKMTINSTSQVAFTNSATEGIPYVVSDHVRAPENIYHCFE